ncbi:cellulose binding domain-containing protein [Luedemannella helvata]
MAGTYSLDVVWTGRFQASVLLRNGTASKQTWTVLLSYGTGITANAAAWVDGAPSPKVSRTGNAWSFTASAPLAAGSNQTLRIQFDISDQRAPTSVSCTVNGRACVMS